MVQEIISFRRWQTIVAEASFLGLQGELETALLGNKWTGEILSNINKEIWLQIVELLQRRQFPISYFRFRVRDLRPGHCQHTLERVIDVEYNRHKDVFRLAPSHNICADCTDHKGYSAQLLQRYADVLYQSRQAGKQKPARLDDCEYLCQLIGFAFILDCGWELWRQVGSGHV